ncbi:MAG: hybrid sensor histidine kinase/response regulator [Candidatus Acidiferrales bacterium]
MSEVASKAMAELRVGTRYLLVRAQVTGARVGRTLGNARRKITTGWLPWIVTYLMSAPPPRSKPSRAARPRMASELPNDPSDATNRAESLEPSLEHAVGATTAATGDCPSAPPPSHSGTRAWEHIGHSGAVLLRTFRSQAAFLLAHGRVTTSHIWHRLSDALPRAKTELLPIVARVSRYAAPRGRALARAARSQTAFLLAHGRVAAAHIGRVLSAAGHSVKTELLPPVVAFWRKHTAYLTEDLFDAFQAKVNLRLRTKFLLSVILITSALTCGSLLIVGRTAQTESQRQIEEEAHNAILTFQVMQHQHEVALQHKADLLAALALMRNGDATTIQEASQDPWQSEDCNLFLLADASGKVVALHTAGENLDAGTAEGLLRKPLPSKETSGWWFSGERLYQFVLRPVYGGADQNHARLGTVVVGRAIDASAANELRRISSSQVAFRYGDKVIVSTLAPLDEANLEQQFNNRPLPSILQIGNEKYLASSVNLTPDRSSGISLIVLKSYDSAILFLNRLNHLLLGLFIVAALVGAVLVFLISDTFTRPLASLVGGVRALEQGNFDYPLRADGGDEVAQVTRAFDGMRTTLQKNATQRQELEEQLRQSQKMEAMGRLAGGVAHDFNNLLTVIKGHSDLLLDRMDPHEPLRGSSQQIAKAADRAAALTRQLLIFSRKQVLQPKILDLNATVSEMGKLLKRLVREDIEYRFQPGDSLGQLKADPGQIEQVLMNLIVNACDAMPGGGKLTVETYNFDVGEELAAARPLLRVGEYVVLAVSDTGCGMDADTKAHIFEPFFTTKEAGKGTGLGLATVYGVVNQSNGHVWVDSEPGKGARFEIYLPRAEEQEMEAHRPVKEVARERRRTETVLIAEDEPAVRELACEFLRAAGYNVLTAADGEEALGIAARLQQPIHALVTDIVLPKLRGPELAECMKKLRPDVKIVYMSGYLEHDKKAAQFLEEGAFLQKPYTRDALVSKVDQILRRAPAEPELASSIR